MKRSTKILLVLLLIAIVIVPLYLQRGAEFGGADGQAEEVIIENNPGYEVWFEPLIELPSGEIESLLFSSQAALGAIIIGYYLGYKKGKREHVGH